MQQQHSATRGPVLVIKWACFYLYNHNQRAFRGLISQFKEQVYTNSVHFALVFNLKAILYLMHHYFLVIMI